MNTYPFRVHKTPDGPSPHNPYAIGNSSEETAQNLRDMPANLSLYFLVPDFHLRFFPAINKEYCDVFVDTEKAKDEVKATMEQYLKHHHLLANRLPE